MRKFTKLSRMLLSWTAVFAIISVLSCKKLVDGSTSNLPNDVVSMDEILQWTSDFIPKMKDRPQFLFDLSQKSFVNGRGYVRIPVLGSGGQDLGFFYFTKTRKKILQSLYVIAEQVDKQKKDGIVAFVDFDNQTYTLAKYQDDKLISLRGLKEAKSFFADAFIKGNGPGGKVKTDRSCSEQTSIIRIGGKDSLILKMNGDIACPGSKTIWQKIMGFFSDTWDSISSFFDSLFGGGSDGSESYAFATGGYFDWTFGGFASVGYSVGVGTGIQGMGGGTQWGPYSVGNGDPEVLADLDDSSIDGDDGVSGNGVDNSFFDQYDPTQPVQSIPDIMGLPNFVRRLTPQQNCLSIARQQIAKLGYFVGGWDSGGQTFQIFKRSTGIDQTAAQNGISYMVSALQKNIPVVIGVDYDVPSPNSDGTTNHFVVVVGMGNDRNGKLFFRFYDNYTSDPIYGANPLNVLTYDPVTGALTGYWMGTKTHRPIFYKVAQIRKSYK